MGEILLIPALWDSDAQVNEKTRQDLNLDSQKQPATFGCLLLILNIKNKLILGSKAVPKKIFSI